MRRSDREVVGLANILSILAKCDIMRLGLCVDNKPYIVPMNFAYEMADEQIYIYFHCASKGKKIDMIAQNDNVCFEADCSFKTVKADSACNWSAEFESIMGEGSIIALTDETQKINALNIIMKRYGFEGTPNYKPHELSAVTVLRVSVTTITGKRKISGSPKFTMAFSIGSTNEERLEAFELYRQAFDAKKLSEGTPPDGDDIHIMMEIYGLEILLGPGGMVGTGFDNVLNCEVRFDNKTDFYKAYDVLIRDSRSHSLEGPYPWAALLALVSDKYGIGWALYFNE